MDSIVGRLRLLAAASCGIGLAACGGSNEHPVAPPTPNVILSGKVTGVTGQGVTLTNGSQQVHVSADGTFTFGALPLGTSYSITAQPAVGRVCQLSANSKGTLAADVRDIAVTCDADPNAPTFKVGGTLAGLPAGAAGLVLHLTSTAQQVDEDLPVDANGAFTFLTALLNEADYAVTIKTAPSANGTNYNCAPAAASGTIDAGAGDVTTVQVQCAFAIGGTITVFDNSAMSGLKLGVTFQGQPVAGVPDLVVSDIAAGPPGPPVPIPYQFGGKAPSSSAAIYTVAITQQPTTGQTCVIAQAGSVLLLSAADVSTVDLVCTTPPVGAAALTGTYQSDTSRSFITFFADGTFLLGTHSANFGESGIEHGLYFKDLFGSDTLFFRILTDTNAAAGLNNPANDATNPFGPGTAFLAGTTKSGNTITGVLGGLTAAGSTPGALLGAWLPGTFSLATFAYGPANNKNVLVYGADGTGFWYSVDNGLPNVSDGCLAGADTSAATGSYTLDVSAACAIGALTGFDSLAGTGLSAIFGQPGSDATAVPYTVDAGTDALSTGSGLAVKPWTRSAVN